MRRTRFPLFLLAFLVLPVFLFPSVALARPYKAVAFDYFVIFNPNSVAAEVEKIFPGKGMDITRAWRSKLFEYGFLRSITGRHRDFFLVAGDALDYTLAAMDLTVTPPQREEMLNAYLTMEPWPDSVAGLKKLRESGFKIITVANLSHDMLIANARHAGIEDLFDELLSTETNGTYKPDPRAYELGLSHLGLQKHEVVFAAFGGWDAYGAKSFGYPTFWVNRFNLPAERMGIEADARAADFQGLLDFVLKE